MRIESYNFGVIKVDGVEYISDLIIFCDLVKPNWWRKQGHRLDIEDIQDVIDFKPELLIIGKGESEMMDIPASTIEGLRTAGIKVIAENTTQACKIFNEQFKKGKKVAGAFHITC